MTVLAVRDGGVVVRGGREREREGWVGCVIALMEQLGQEDAERKRKVNE